ncbi:unnamed protein product [Echinostoma caproni]|uniref:EGF-like domain-containing protein n=1 Tax=Echinostoma caproni TaxID=27848 RepID=A0A183ADW4_9TREM|nr:unnamed protein product [Echinostoma caproni]
MFCVSYKQLFLCFGAVYLLSQTNGALIQRSGEYSLRLQYLIRQCVPLCANDGQLYVPDRLWKKCSCVCPRGYTGIACERRVEEHKRNYPARLTGTISESSIGAGEEQPYPEDSVMNYYTQWSENPHKHVQFDNAERQAGWAV